VKATAALLWCTQNRVFRTMEIRMDAVTGETPPPDTFVSMRVGDVQKQTRFEKTRTYRFPNPKDTRDCFGRIEVFKRIGMMTVPLDVFRRCEGDEEPPVLEVPCSYHNFNRLSIRLDVQDVEGNVPPISPLSLASDKTGRSAASKARLDAAQQYLSDWKLEDLLADAMREVIRDRPTNPFEYLSEHILQQGNDKENLLPLRTNDHTMRSTPSSQSKGVSLLQSSQDEHEQRFHKEQAKASKPIPLSSTSQTPALSSSFGAYYRANFHGINYSEGEKLYSKFKSSGLAVGTSTGCTSPKDEFYYKPSVGTGLLDEPPEVKPDKPWYFETREAGDHTEYVRSLQQLISEKDDELARLKAQVTTI